MGNTIPGALAEYFILYQHALVKAPDYLSDDEAASVGCAGLTAWYPLVEKGQLKANLVRYSHFFAAVETSCSERSLRWPDAGSRGYAADV